MHFIKQAFLLWSFTLTISAQTICPPKTNEKQQKPLFDRIFGQGPDYYCPNDILNTSIQDKNIIGKWTITESLRKFHKLVESPVQELARIHTFEFHKDRTVTFTGDSGEVSSMGVIYWAYPGNSEKIKAYGDNFENDSTEYSHLKGNNIYFFKLNKKGFMVLAWYVPYQVRELSKKKLILGGDSDEQKTYDFYIAFRKKK